jgi:DNA-binding NtrC family response regulator
MASAILVVDDNSLFLDTVTMSLSKRGYHVLKAQGPSEALRVARNEPAIDVVISDINMPEMAGTDLVHQLGRVLPQTACILMTAGEVSLPAMPKGVPVLSKPISISDLVVEVERALARTAKLRAQLVQSLEENTRLRRESGRLHAESQSLVREAARRARQLNRGRPSKVSVVAPKNI